MRQWGRNMIDIAAKCYTKWDYSAKYDEIKTMQYNIMPYVYKKQHSIYMYMNFIKLYLFTYHLCTKQFIWVQCDPMQYIKIQYNEIQWNTMKYNGIQYNTIQYNTMKYNTAHWNTIQYNTMKYNTTRRNTRKYNTTWYMYINKREKSTVG